MDELPTIYDAHKVYNSICSKVGFLWSCSFLPSTLGPQRNKLIYSYSISKLLLLLPVDYLMFCHLHSFNNFRLHVMKLVVQCISVDHLMNLILSLQCLDKLVSQTIFDTLTSHLLKSQWWQIFHTAHSHTFTQWCGLSTCCYWAIPQCSFERLQTEVSCYH